jgi:DNA invertase Pin-like site-specific DNA recombinase
MVPRQATPRYIAYYRVSTARQGRSGLGLDAQKAAVQEFLGRTGGQLRADFTEVQSGKDDTRTQLADALKLCKLTNSTLLIAKLDRLSRNVAFLATLHQSNTKFVACDLPEANELVVHILAAVAQAERKAISERTRAALAAAKARGVQLGNPRLRPGTRESALVASAVASARARQRAHELREVLEHAKKQGATTLRLLADHLNDLGVSASQGGRWHPNSVRRVCALIKTAGANITPRT